MALAIANGAIGYVGLAFGPRLADAFGLSPRVITTLSITSLGAAAAGFLLAYLRGDVDIPFINKLLVERAPSDPYEWLPQQWQHELAILRSRLDSVAGNRADLSQEDRASLLQALRAEVTASLSSQVLDEMRRQYLEAVAERHDNDQLRQQRARTIERLRVEIAILSRRGNLNLVIGTVTTALAIGMLVYMITGLEANVATLPAILSYFVPRVTTVVFIEVFAFFFLRLYRASLTDIKYYHNELTTLEVRSMALETAIGRGSAESMRSVLDHLARLDRNATASNGSDTPAGVIAPKDVADIVERLLKLSTGEKGKD